MEDGRNDFQEVYRALRPGYEPMRWMKRMFLRLIDGNPPALVDLLTGAGKTDLIVIWLIALASYAKNRSTAKPVPRRLVWVVNRRVLVQQVHQIAEELNTLLKAQPASTETLISQLRTLCRPDSKSAFNIVQLRGQRLDDREWALDPTTPQLIIGTVDQIGSRLLFQGYGQGKWSRPMHAGLLGVDAWVCIDEAHLVPSFVVTLRQIRELNARPPEKSVPAVMTQFFEKLPFWTTELSATPGLPPPRHGSVFALQEEDETDPVIAPRLQAKETRCVIWKAQPEKKHLVRDLAAEALQIAKEAPGSAIAVFCSIAEKAKDIAKKLEAEYQGRVLLVTGRIRGYERDRLERNPLFRRFREPHPQATPTADTPPTFLVGTAAAEVGLDADASAIVCDFASLLTLIQRLGRLDRRGQFSKQAAATGGAPPTMTIIGGSSGKTTESQLRALASRLKSAFPVEGSEFGTEFFVGAPWSVVVGKEETGSEAEESQAEGSDLKQDANQGETSNGAKFGVDDAVDSATWRVAGLPVGNLKKKEDEHDAEKKNDLQPATESEAANPVAVQVTIAMHNAVQPGDWLSHPLAGITAGPVVVPPLTDAVLRRWAATTPRPPKFLPVHPWLYGLLPDDESTPLVGIAFRLELDILQHCDLTDEEEEEGGSRHWEKVSKILTDFPPLKSELHFAQLGKVREWLESLDGARQSAMALFDGDEWTDSILPDELTANSVLVLPTSMNPDTIGEIIPKGGGEEESQRCWDVFEALSKEGAKYLRQVTTNSPEIRAGLNGEEGVYRLPDFKLNEEATEPADLGEHPPIEEKSDLTKWKRARIKLGFSKNGITFELRYFTPNRGTGSVLDLLPTHLAAAADHGRKLARALASGDNILAALFSHTGQQHDIGKDHPKWQQAMGNTRTWREKEAHDESIRVAKPVIENPGNAGGYRHEWGTLWSIKDETTPIAPALDESAMAFLHDCHLHSIAAHHGYFRPSMPDRGFDSPPTVMKQNPVRLGAIERSARLQRQLGYWRLAYLESLIKVADVGASRDAQTEELENES